MCHGCSPQKLTRTYSKGLVVQILGKPPRPCASPRNSTTTTTETPPCSPRPPPSSTNTTSSSSISVDKPEKQDQMMVEQHVVLVDSPRSREAKSMKGPGGSGSAPSPNPSWKMFTGGEQTRLGAGGEIGESVMDVDTTTTTSKAAFQRCMEVNPEDYASKYRTCWC